MGAARAGVPIRGVAACPSVADRSSSCAQGLGITPIGATTNGATVGTATKIKKQNAPCPARFLYPMTTTRVPSDTRGYKLTMSWLHMRIQPDDT